MSRVFESKSTFVDVDAEWLCETSPDEINPWCLELSLLQQKQIDRLTILFASGHCLNFQVNPALIPSNKSALNKQLIIFISKASAPARNAI